MMFMFLAALGTPSMTEVPYGIATWPEDGFGNHRAVVRVEAPADAVLARVVWRRRDPNPEAKDIRVYDATTGTRVTDVVRVRVERHEGVIVFRPNTVPGDYYVYYLPYSPGKGNFDDAGTYYPPSDTADPAWVARYASPDALASLPQATTLRIEARGEFHRMDPMEVVASEEEVQALLGRYPTSDYMLFPEERTRPIRMPDDLPLDWVRRGPSNTFRGEVQPNEWYAFQIGVWAAHTSVHSVKVTASDLTAADGKTIPASRISCINTEGKDWLGRDMRPGFSIGKGLVRPLWLLVDVPPNATGTYEGTVTIAPANLPPQTVRVQLVVGGAPLPDHGVSELWRMSRLMWLNSGLGLGDDPIPPYTPLKIQGDRVSCLGRTVRFGPEGLPAQISAKRFDILASPMRFLVVTDEGPLSATAMTTRTLRQSTGKRERETVCKLGTGAQSTTRMRMEFDGCLSFETTVRANEPLRLRDIRLEIPVRVAAARYLMGFGVRRGFRKGDVRWKWNVDRADNQVWVGDAAGGLQLTLQGPRDVWDVITLREAGLPPSWHNDGKGGCDVVQTEGESGPVVIQAYSGERLLKGGEEITFRYRLLISPFRPLDRRHWSWRYGPADRGGNILHIHHGTPGNSYINYPFLETDVLKETVQRAKNTPVAVAPGRLRYPVAGVLNLSQGAMHIWVSLRFDPTKGEAGNAAYNKSLMSIELPNHDQLALYWNIDVRGLRAYVRKGTSAYPTMVDAPLPEWRQGQTHLLTLSWGPQLSIYVNGQLRAQGGYAGLEGPAPAGSELVFSGGGFGIRAIKVASRPHDEAETPTAKVDGNTLLLDTFEKVRSSRTQPLAGPAGNLSGSPVIQRLRPAQAGISRELRLSGKSHKGGAGREPLLHSPGAEQSRDGDVGVAQSGRRDIPDARDVHLRRRKGHVRSGRWRLPVASGASGERLRACVASASA